MKQFILSAIILGLLSFSAKAQDAVVVNNVDPDKNVTVKELYIPNAFTPNGDGLNDYFKIVNLRDEKVIDFRVFNRWGTIMFRGEDNNASWDGKYKDKLQPTGVYGYLIKVGYPDGKIVTYKGTITLLN